MRDISITHRSHRINKLSITQWLTLAVWAGLWVLPGVVSRVSAQTPAPSVSDQYLDILSDRHHKQLSEPIFDNSNAKTIRLSLQDSIRRALEHNLDIRIGSYDPAIQLTDVVRAEAAFDAVLFGSGAFGNRDQANLRSDFFTETVTTGQGQQTIKRPLNPFIRTHDTNYAVGLSKRLPTGATIEISQALRKFRDFQNSDLLFYDPFYETTLEVELRQPLLRDFGIDLNRAAINASRNNYRISQHQFHLLVIQTVAEVERNYWQLTVSRQQAMIFENLLQQAEINLSRLDARKVFDARSTIISRNRALIARARANLISARNSILQRQDQFIESLNDPTLKPEEDWEILVSTPPTSQAYLIDRDRAIAAAVRMRPEMAAQKIQMDTRALAVGVAENQLLPRLDLLLQNEITGAGTDSGMSWDNQNRLNTQSYQFGLSFELPLGGNRAARADLVRAKHQQIQEKLSLESIRRQIIADISISVHALQSAYDEIKERRNAAQAEADTLTAYRAQEDAHAAITADFLNRKIDSLERVSNAQLNLIQALLDYNIAIINVNRAQGVLLRYNNIKLAELPSEK